MPSKSQKQENTCDPAREKRANFRPNSGRTGAEDTQAFIRDVRGKGARWPMLLGVSLLIVCMAGLSISRILFKNAHQISTQSSITDGSGSDAAAGAIDPLGEKVRKPLFSLQSEAEASVERTPKSAAMHSMALAENYMQKEDYAKAVAAYERALSIYPDLPNCSNKLEDARESLIFDQVQDLFEAISAAVKNENLETFLAYLDESERDFFKKQRRKASFLFKRFEKIDGSYTEMNIRILNDSELAVSVRCKVEAAFSSSGRPITLFDGDQHVTLKRAADTIWKICAIED